MKLLELLNEFLSASGGCINNILLIDFELNFFFKFFTKSGFKDLLSVSINALVLFLFSVILIFNYFHSLEDLK